MKNEQANQFYREVGEICQRYGVGAFVGWYVMQNGDGDGHFKFYNPADHEMKACALIMGAMVENWQKQTDQPGDQTTEIKAVLSGKPLDN